MKIDGRDESGNESEDALPGEQLYLFHCHNLEHEDGNMMVNYRIPA